MPHPDLTLSRRRLLAGAITLGAGSAASGAGAFALFSDAETGSGTLSAGTFDLVLGDGDATSPVTFMDVDGIVPGDSGTETLALENAGSITGYLDVRVAGVRDTAGSDGSADLADEIEVVAYVDGGAAGRTYLCPTFGGSATVFSSVFVADEVHSLDYELAGDEQATFYLEWQLPAEAGNEIQGDGVGLDLEFLFNQEPLDNGTATCQLPNDDSEKDDSGDNDSEEDSESDGLTTSTGTGTARGAMGGWDWATLARYGVPDHSSSNGEDYEVGFFKQNEGRIHAANHHLQHDWTSGVTEAFSVEFDGSQVTTTIGGTEYPDKNGNSSQGVGDADVVKLGVTAVADAEEATVTVTDITLDSDDHDGVEIGTVTAESDGDGTRHIVVEFGDEPIEESFSLSGDVTFEWDENADPEPDDLVFRVDVKTRDDD